MPQSVIEFGENPSPPSTTKFDIKKTTYKNGVKFWIKYAKTRGKRVQSFLKSITGPNLNRKCKSKIGYKPCQKFQQWPKTIKKNTE